MGKHNMPDKRRPKVFILAKHSNSLFYASNVACIDPSEFIEPIFVFTPDDYDAILSSRDDAPTSFKHGARIVFNNGEIQALARIDALPADISTLIIDACARNCTRCITHVQYRPDIINLDVGTILNIGTTLDVAPGTAKDHETHGAEIARAAVRMVLRRAALRRKYTLATRLALEQRPWLQKIARSFAIPGCSRMDKATLISSICIRVVDMGAQIDPNL